jgi:hypothetical protein
MNALGVIGRISQAEQDTTVTVRLKHKAKVFEKGNDPEK